MLARVGAKLRSFWPVQMLKLIILLLIPYRISMESVRSNVYIHLSSIFWQWSYYTPGVITGQSFGSMSYWTAVANVLVIAAPSFYFCYRLRGMSETESCSWLAASTTAVSFICYILISSSYGFVVGAWRENDMYWCALQGFVTVLLALLVFVPTLKRVSDKCLPKRQIRRIRCVRDRLHHTLLRLRPQHASGMMILAALVLPYGFGVLVDTFANSLSFVSPLVGMFSIYFQIVHTARTPFLPLRTGFFMQIGSTTDGFVALGILWLQLLYAHEVLRYVEGRVGEKRVKLMAFVLLVPFAFIGVSSGVVMMLGLANSAFIPFPVSVFVGLWLIQRKDRLFSKGDAELVELEPFPSHENEVCVPIIYILESRLKKRLRRHKS